MQKITYLLGVTLLAFALFAAVLVGGQTGASALAQDSSAEATPVPEEEVETAEAETDMASSETMTETMAASDPAVVAFQEAIAASEESLFVNLSTDDLDRSAMAVNFAHKILNGKEIPVTIFLNVEGVRLVDSSVPQNIHVTGESVQEKLVNFMADGGTVLICPFCMQNVGGMTQGDVIDGVLLGGPEMTWTALFAEGARVLSY
jgi:predicted peroxiredoxin